MSNLRWDYQMSNVADMSQVPEPGKYRTGATEKRRDKSQVEQEIQEEPPSSNYKISEFYLTPMVEVPGIEPGSVQDLSVLLRA
jgi:hypothetical protein